MKKPMKFYKQKQSKTCNNNSKLNKNQFKFMSSNMIFRNCNSLLIIHLKKMSIYNH